MTQAKSRTLSALKACFLPLANILLKNKIGAGPVVRQLKLAFVEAAKINHGRAGKPASVNAIANLTGLSRRHIKELLAEVDAESNFEDIAAPYESGVLTTWVRNTAYLDNSGRPRHLEEGPGPGTFRSLIAETVPADEVDRIANSLLTVGSAVRRPDGKIELKKRGFLVGEDLARNLVFAISSLAHTLDHNWQIPLNERFQQRVIHTNRLDPKNRAVFRRMSNERIIRFSEDTDDLLQSYENADNQHEGTRIGVGVYYFEVDGES